MDDVLLALRAAAEPTRLRLIALAARGAFCVSEFCEILGQSQPRVSRHLRLLHEAGLLERLREGVNAWFALPEGPRGALAREILSHLPAADPLLEADRRHAARVLAERARDASESFRRQGADWDEMRALGLPAAEVEAALLAALPAAPIPRLLDIGTGTGRILELLAPRARAGLGIDASKAMLALARARLARSGISHCTVRLADMYRLPLPDSGFDAAVLHMVLHHAEDPALALAEAARVLRPGGALLVVDLAQHDRADLLAHHAHRHAGFAAAEMQRLLRAAGFAAAGVTSISGPLQTMLWTATRQPPARTPRAAAPTDQPRPPA
jgi:ArsR family transcriptional regulator